MYRGAFAMFDALGIRGIWRDHPTDKLLAKFEALRKAFEKHIDGQNISEARRPPGNPIEVVRFAFLSDTVVVGVGHRPAAELRLGPGRGEGFGNDNYWDCFTLAVASGFTAVATQLAAREEPRWSYRGCISVGEFAMDPSSSFFVGEAVDDAAENMNTAQGALVWLTPRAADLVRRAKVGVGGPPFWSWRVPLKGQGELDTFAVSPFDSQPEEEHQRTFTDIMATFTGSKARFKLDVELKRQNTERFLRHDLEKRKAMRTGGVVTL